MDIKKVQIDTDHPLEEFFEILPGTTVVERTEVVPSELVVVPTYDEKDIEVENQYEQIYTIAMSQVQELGDQIEQVEGKFKARMGEVSATMLSVALNAVQAKANLKVHKDKQSTVPQQGQRTVNNNLIVADRNEILKALGKKK